MNAKPEMLMLQHRFTEQIICVDRDAYLAQAHGRYRNWQMKGQGRFIAPPPLIPEHESRSATATHDKEEPPHVATEHTDAA